MASDNPLDVNFDPTKVQPLFVAEYITCAFPTSDLWGSSPRYLYYALLLLVFATQNHGWLANVFLGAAATYAGTAAIEALVLISNPPTVPTVRSVAIPYINSSTLANNDTLEGVGNLVTDYDALPLVPATLDLDVDAILAVVVTGFLLMLPMHCWASVVRRNRARHLLMSLWNVLMLAGTCCALVLWAQQYQVPLQFRFCYPELTDGDSTTNDAVPLPPGIWQGDWNSTIWHTFQDFRAYSQLSTNCLYPCFDTTRIIRRSNSMVANIAASSRSFITNPLLSDSELSRIEWLQNLIYTAVGISALSAILLLIFTMPALRRATRVPISSPKLLFRSVRRGIFVTLGHETVAAINQLGKCLVHPHMTLRAFHSMQRGILIRRSLHVVRFFFDIIAIALLFVATVLIPVIMIAFICWIEWNIHNNSVSDESLYEVGQWNPVVSIALVLLSAFVLKLQYPLATIEEIETELVELRQSIGKLEKLLVQKQRQQARNREECARSDTVTELVQERRE